VKRIIIFAPAGFVLRTVGMASGAALALIELSSRPEPRLEQVWIVPVSFDAAGQISSNKGGST
jgi:hypothetical protein